MAAPARVLARMRAAYVRMRREALYRRTAGRGAPLVILRYHAVGEPDEVSRYVHPGLAVSPARFREHVRTLKKRFRVIGPGEIDDAMASRAGGRTAALITFDDGYADNYQKATPILVDERATGAFYVATRALQPNGWLWTCELWRVLPALPTGLLALPEGLTIQVPASEAERRTVGRGLTVSLSAMSGEAREDVLEELWRRAGRPRGEGLEGTFVTPAQIRAMRAAGMTIGAHTRNHPQLDLLADEHREPELRGSRADLEAITGEPVTHLAYPNPGGSGTIQPAVRAAASRAGFETAVTSVPGPITPGTDRLRLPRLGIYAGDQERQLFATLERLH